MKAALCLRMEFSVLLSPSFSLWCPGRWVGNKKNYDIKWKEQRKRLLNQHRTQKAFNVTWLCLLAFHCWMFTALLPLCSWMTWYLNKLNSAESIPTELHFSIKYRCICLYVCSRGASSCGSTEGSILHKSFHWGTVSAQIPKARPARHKFLSTCGGVGPSQISRAGHGRQKEIKTKTEELCKPM